MPGMNPAAMLMGAPGMPGAGRGGPPSAAGGFSGGLGNGFNGGAGVGNAAPDTAGVAGSAGGAYSPRNVTPENALSPEAQVLLMEKARLDNQEAVTQGIMPPLPPTAITPSDATGVGGKPLVTLPPVPGH